MLDAEKRAEQICLSITKNNAVGMELPTKTRTDEPETSRYEVETSSRQTRRYARYQVPRLVCAGAPLYLSLPH